MATGQGIEVTPAARLARGGEALGAAWPLIAGATALALVGLQASLSLGIAGEDGFLGARPARWALATYAGTVTCSALAAALAPARLRWLALLPGGLMLAAATAATAAAGAEGWSMLAAALTLTAAWRLGHGALRLSPFRATGLADDGTVSLVAGLGLLATATFVLGTAGWIRVWTVGTAVLVLGLAGAAGLVRRAGAPDPGGLVSTPLRAAVAGILAVQGAFAVVWAAAPEVQFDALHYKAWLPALWADAGGIDAQTFLDHPTSTYLGLGQLVAVPGHLLGAPGVGRYLQLLAAAVLVAVVWRAGGRARGAAGPVAALAVGLAPHVVWQASTAYDDLLLALLVVGAALAVLRAGDRPARSLVAATAVGFLAGTCVTGKLHLAAFSVALGACFCLAARDAGDVLRRAGGLLTGGLAGAGPLLLYRWVEAGNPVFPYYSAVFGDESFGADIRGFVSPDDPQGLGGLPGGLWQLVRHENAFVEVAAPGALGLLVLLLAAAILTGWYARPAARAVWGALALSLGAWWLQFQYLRFLLPYAILAALVALPAFASEERRLAGRGAQTAAVAVAAVAACALLVSTTASFFNVPGLVPLAAASGVEPPARYVRTAVREASALAVFDRLAGPGEEVAGGVHARALLPTDRDLTTGWELLEQLARRGPLPEGPEAARAALAGLGVGWVVLADQARLLDPEGMPPQDAFLVELVRARGQLVFADREHDLYRLGRPAELRLAPAGFCDEALAGEDGCWFGAVPLDAAPGLAPGETGGEPVGQIAPACPGALYALEVVSGGEDDLLLTLVFDDPDPSRGRTLLFVPPGRPAVLHGTAPPGARTARVTLHPLGERAAVERARVSVVSPPPGSPCPQA